MPVSGQDGSVKMGVGTAATVADVRKFTLNKTHGSVAYNSSSTAGQTARLKGNKDWTATVSIYTDADGVVPVEEGDYVAVELYTTTGDYYGGNAWVDGVSFEIDIEGANVIAAEIALSANGAVAKT